jgi:hypothetical protein
MSTLKMAVFTAFFLSKNGCVYSYKKVNQQYKTDLVTPLRYQPLSP